MAFEVGVEVAVGLNKINAPAAKARAMTMNIGMEFFMLENILHFSETELNYLVGVGRRV